MVAGQRSRTAVRVKKPIRRGKRGSGTALENRLPSPTQHTTMTNSMERYRKIKRQAMQLMLIGDVERYMRALRLMSRLAMR
jgi:hypothetical protein